MRVVNKGVLSTSYYSVRNLHVFIAFKKYPEIKKNIFYSTTYHGYVLMQGCADWDGVGERHAPPIFSNLQERWSKGVRELAKVFCCDFFFLVTVVGQYTFPEFYDA